MTDRTESSVRLDVIFAMDRRVVFTHVVGTEGMDDPEGGFYNPKLSIDFWFETYEPHYTWVINVEVVCERLKRKPDANMATIREVVFSTRVTGNKDMFMLAKAANSCDPKTSGDIAHHIFWTHVIEPSVLDHRKKESDNWFKIYAPSSWGFYSRSIIGEMERKCGDVHNS